jgi:hypothetical protein
MSEVPPSKLYSYLIIPVTLKPYMGHVRYAKLTGTVRRLEDGNFSLVVPWSVDKICFSSLYISLFIFFRLKDPEL